MPTGTGEEMSQSASHTNIEGRSATLLVHGDIDQLRQLVIETLNAEGWVRITPSAPVLVFRARFFGWLPGAVWVEVGLSNENDGVMVSFAAYGSVTHERRCLRRSYLRRRGLPFADCEQTRRRVRESFHQVAMTFAGFGRFTVHQVVWLQLPARAIRSRAIVEDRTVTPTFLRAKHRPLLLLSPLPSPG